mmetsp:Transcript_41697/g.37115  ORF Transcript_41697/g.37115 Transcript_41697/m.37115 type:complete len:99 (+) Transcript_41697:108-404(+)
MLKQPSLSKPTPKANIPSDCDTICDYKFIKVLADSRFKAILIYSTSDDEYQVMKVFPTKKGDLTRNYQSEKFLQRLCHPNIIQIRSCQDIKKPLPNEN